MDNVNLPAGTFWLRRGLSQETLKLIACITMLLDHIGAVFVRGYTLRIIGRIAFPIYCFLLAEGAYYTKNPRKYAFRLLVGLLLAEIPFDITFRMHLDLTHQNVMFTMLFGFTAVELIHKYENGFVRILIAAAGYALGEYLKTDYGGNGVLLIVLFSQSRGQLWFQTILLAMFCLLSNSLKIPVFGFTVPIELFALLAMIPIACYSGRKVTSGKAVQWAFYLFYPVHLAVLFVIRYLVYHQPSLTTIFRIS